MTVKLSLCIPTYNRGGFIGETLESIVSQATDDIEIIVSDNASQDDTEAIVRGFQERFPRITYHRFERNMGADKNFLKVVELATGEYCWFMGSDDKVENGGIATVLANLAKHPDLAGFLSIATNTLLTCVAASSRVQFLAARCLKTPYSRTPRKPS